MPLEWGLQREISASSVHLKDTFLEVPILGGWLISFAPWITFLGSLFIFVIKSSLFNLALLSSGRTTKNERTSLGSSWRLHIMEWPGIDEFPAHHHHRHHQYHHHNTALGHQYCKNGLPSHYPTGIPKSNSSRHWVILQESNVNINMATKGKQTRNLHLLRRLDSFKHLYGCLKETSTLNEYMWLL